MFQAQRILLQFATKQGLSKPFATTTRFNSSSVGKLNNSSSSTSTTATTATADNNQLNNSNNNKLNVELEKKIPFMPVINIPETEFAHHSFFSLHRPLLGLSDEDETPFFSQKQPKSEGEREQEKSK